MTALATWRRGALLLLAGLASGCATLASSNGPDVVDTVQVNAVEQAARNQGNQVIWINAPTRPPDLLTVVVTVTTLVPKRSPEDVETQVTVPIERALAKVPGWRRIVSQTREDRSYFEVTLFGTDRAKAEATVKAALIGVRARLPAEATAPLVSATDMPKAVD